MGGHLRVIGTLRNYSSIFGLRNSVVLERRPLESEVEIRSHDRNGWGLGSGRRSVFFEEGHEE